MTYEIETRELSPQPMVGIRRTTTMAEIQKTLGEVLGGTFGYVMERGGQPVGPPFTIYHSFAEGTIDLEGGCPTAGPMPGAGDVKPGELPGGKVAFTWHIGPYDKIGDAHAAVQTWIAREGLTQAGPAWEVYWTDPGQEPDPTKWKTEVLVPIA